MKGDPKFKKPTKGHKNTDSLSAIKKKIRDTERLLARGNLQATSTAELQRRLTTLKTQITLKTASMRESEMYQKYKFVRHIEHQKIKRQIAKLEKIQDANQLAIEKLHLLYVDHFPRDMKYISILQSDSDSAQKSEQGTLDSTCVRNKILAVIKNKHELGETEKKGFELRMCDVLDKNEQLAYLEWSRLKGKFGSLVHNSFKSDTKGTAVAKVSEDDFFLGDNNADMHNCYEEIAGDSSFKRANEGSDASESGSGEEKSKPVKTKKSHVIVDEKSVPEKTKKKAQISHESDQDNSERINKRKDRKSEDQEKSGPVTTKKPKKLQIAEDEKSEEVLDGKSAEKYDSGKKKKSKLGDGKRKA